MIRQRRCHMAMGFRRKATSRGVRYNRNPAQALGEVQCEARHPLPLIASGECYKKAHHYLPQISYLHNLYDKISIYVHFSNVLQVFLPMVWSCPAFYHFRTQAIFEQVHIQLQQKPEDSGRLS